MSNFVFCDRPELLAQGIKLSSDGHLTNLIDVDYLTVQSENRMPFRGAREKSSNYSWLLLISARLKMTLSWTSQPPQVLFFSYTFLLICFVINLY
jgi:hypothetical protein